MRFFSKLTKKNDDELKWFINCSYIPDKSVEDKNVKGTIMMTRAWKKSSILFKSTDLEQDIFFDMDTFQFEAITRSTKRLGLDFTDKLLKCSFVNKDGVHSDFLFNLPNRKFEEAFHMLQKFIEEYKHQGHEFEIKTRNEIKKILLNMYRPTLHVDDGEEFLVNEIPTPDMNQVIVFTNFRIFYLYKKENEVIQPIPLPVDIHSENVRREITTTSSGSVLDSNNLNRKHQLQTRTREVVVGDVVIFDHKGEEYSRIYVRDPDDIVNRYNIANKRFVKEGMSSVPQKEFEIKKSNKSKIHLNINSIIDSNNQVVNQGNVNNWNVNLAKSTKTDDDFELEELSSIIESIKITQQVAGLPSDISERINKILEIIEKQQNSEEPNRVMINDMLKTIKSILNSSSAAVLFSGVLERMTRFVSQ